MHCQRSAHGEPATGNPCRQSSVAGAVPRTRQGLFHRTASCTPRTTMPARSLVKFWPCFARHCCNRSFSSYPHLPRIPLHICCGEVARGWASAPRRANLAVDEKLTSARKTLVCLACTLLSTSFPHSTPHGMWKTRRCRDDSSTGAHWTSGEKLTALRKALPDKGYSGLSTCFPRLSPHALWGTA